MNCKGILLSGKEIKAVLPGVLIFTVHFIKFNKMCTTILQ